MKIAIELASRGRPLQLIGAIYSLWRLRSGYHDVGFLIGVDADDQETMEACEKLSKDIPLIYRTMERPRALVALHNMILGECEDADFITNWNDRNQCLTLGWDEGIVQASAQKPDRVMWWSSPQDPGCTMPIWPKSYLKAAGHKWAPEIFPFWFDDTWLMQVDRLAFGGPALKAPVWYGTDRGRTTRGRDFAFWGDVFAGTLPIRVAESQEICSAFGTKWEAHPDLIEEFNREAEAFAKRADEFETVFADSNGPTSEYIAAKEAAERFLKEAA